MRAAPVVLVLFLLAVLVGGGTYALIRIARPNASMSPARELMRDHDRMMAAGARLARKGRTGEANVYYESATRLMEMYEAERNREAT